MSDKEDDTYTDENGSEVSIGFDYHIRRKTKLELRLETLDKIKAIRAKNNEVWMQFPKVLAELAPDKFEEIIKKIIEYDKEINELSKELL